MVRIDRRRIDVVPRMSRNDTFGDEDICPAPASVTLCPGTAKVGVARGFPCLINVFCLCFRVQGYKNGWGIEVRFRDPVWSGK